MWEPRAGQCVPETKIGTAGTRDQSDLARNSPDMICS